MTRTRRALLALLTLALLKRPADVLLAAMLPDAAVNPLPGRIAGMAAALLLLGLPAWLLCPWTSANLPRAKSPWPGMGLAVMAALLARAAMSPVDAAWQSFIGIAPDALPVPNSLSAAIAYAAALAVIPAVAEEAFFRGALLTALTEGCRRGGAVLIVSLAFALMHGSAANLPSLLVISLLLTLLMLHTGRIAVPMAAHLVYNLSALSGTALPPWMGAACGAGLLALTGYLYLGRPAGVRPPMQKADCWIAAASLAVLTALYFI